MSELVDDGAVLDGAHFGERVEEGSPSAPATPSVCSDGSHASGDAACLRLLQAELEAALHWFVDITVDVTFYEGAALFLGEPRQRAKLVRYVVEQARSFKESDRLERQLGWRDHPSLIAAESLRLERTIRAELRVASVPNRAPVPSAQAVSPVLAMTPRSDQPWADPRRFVKVQ